MGSARARGFARLQVPRPRAHPSPASVVPSMPSRFLGTLQPQGCRHIVAPFK